MSSSRADRVREIFWLEKMPADEFTPSRMCRALDVSLYRKFESEAKIAGASLKEVNERNINEGNFNEGKQ
jgi:hypothetical protein